MKLARLNFSTSVEMGAPEIAKFDYGAINVTTSWHTWVHFAHLTFILLQM